MSAKMNICKYRIDVNSNCPDETKAKKVDITDFNLIKVIAAGMYGELILVRKNRGKDANQIYAMKVLKKAEIVPHEKLRQYTKSEREILESVSGLPFLPTLHYAFQNETKLYLIMDYVRGGDMHLLLCNEGKLTEDQTRIYVGEIILAIEQLHKLLIIHRDLKLENILIDEAGHIVLVDFGLSKKFPTKDKCRRTHSLVGTPEYMAPEIVCDATAGYGKASDWWSVGIIMFELLTGVTPFARKNENRATQIYNRIEKLDPIFPDDLSNEAKDCMRRLLRKSPHYRLGARGAQQIKCHEFFKLATSPFSWSALSKKEMMPPFVPSLDCEEKCGKCQNRFHILNHPNKDSVFRGFSFDGHREEETWHQQPRR